MLVGGNGGAAAWYLYFHVLLFVMAKTCCINYIRFICDYDIRKQISFFTFDFPMAVRVVVAGCWRDPLIPKAARYV